MAKSIKRQDKRRQREEVLPLGGDNFKIIGAGIAVIIAGYLALAKGPIEGFFPLVLAPILLVLGYCVIIPLGIFYKKSYLKSENLSKTKSVGQ